MRFFMKIAALLLALCVIAPALAEETPARVVRVGFYHSEGYHIMDEAGNKSGYGYEVLQAMKIYNNWTYEYVGYDKGWKDIQQMLLDGEIDLVVSGIKTPARMETYDFSERAIAQSGACLMVRASDSPYVAGDFSAYNGMRVGFIANSAQIASMEAFAAEHGFAYEAVYYDTSGELEAAILEGDEIDALVTSNMRIISGTRRLELFAMQDVHVMLRKGDTELLREVDYALEQISIYNPGLYDSLYGKYYSIETGGDVFFSPEERAFVEECAASGAVFTVAISPDMQPYSYYENGEPVGILFDIATEALARTGLKFELIPTYTNAEYRELVASGDVDVRLTARQDFNYAEKMRHTLIDPYYSTDVSRVTRKGDTDAVKTVAAVKDSLIDTDYLPSVLTEDTVVKYFNDVSECVAAVLSGDCDAVYLLTRTAQSVVYDDDTNRLVSVIMPRYSVNFCLSVCENKDSRLSSMLEKSVASLSENDIADIVRKYTDPAIKNLSLIGILYSNPILATGAVALILILAFAMVLIVYMTRRRRVERDQNIRLSEALSYAEQANNAKSVFMSRMSHEIRTPLNAIIGYNSMTEAAFENARGDSEILRAAERAADWLSKSNIASKHLLTVINDVLDMSAIESGKLRIANEVFDFKNLVLACTAIFSMQAKNKGVDLAVRFSSPTDERFMGDQMRVNQILTNLLANAVKFTPEGGNVVVTIGQENISASVARMRFTVQDTGIGMSGEFVNRIWRPFEQADATIARRYGGSGLGLSICKSLVDLMGGEICVESELGKGSCFTVDLNFGRAEDFTRDVFAARARTLALSSSEQSRDYMARLFEELGAICRKAAPGDEISGEQCEICVVDCVASGDIAKARKSAGKSARLAAVAYDAAEFKAEGDAAGAEAILAKPMFMSTARELLTLLTNKKIAAPGETPLRPNFKGARVLLAEDNVMNMEIAKALLKSWNIDVVEAWSGREALEKFIQSKPGELFAILMDVHMPEMDGYAATRAIRASQHPDAREALIIAMTADVFAEDIAAAVNSGMNAHIGKPIDREKLYEALTARQP